MSGVAPDPPNRNLVPADLEQYLRANGGPVRCCMYWPECSHMLAFIEQQAAPPNPDDEDGAADMDVTDAMLAAFPALVEVARAAREVVIAHKQANLDADGDDDWADYWWPSVVDLAAALARLDKDTA